MEEYQESGFGWWKLELETTVNTDTWKMQSPVVRIATRTESQKVRRAWSPKVAPGAKIDYCEVSISSSGMTANDLVVVPLSPTGSKAVLPL